MANYFDIAKKLVVSEARLSALLDELREIRRQAKACNYTNPEHAPRCEKVYDDAVKEQGTAQELLGKLTELHKKHWQREYERQLDAAHQALIPLARAWLISHRAFGATGHFPTWLSGRLGEMTSAAEQAAMHDTHELPFDPPKSFTLELADDELVC